MVYEVELNADNGGASVASVGFGTPPPPDDRRKREEECFGVPRLWFLPFVGVAIVIIGISQLLQGVTGWKNEYVWPLIIIIFGVLVIVAAIYRPRYR